MLVSGEFEEHSHPQLLIAKGSKQQFSEHLQCLRLSGKYVFMYWILVASQWGKATIILIFTDEYQWKSVAFLGQMASMWTTSNFDLFDIFSR